jgi:hypothetical protein
MCNIVESSDAWLQLMEKIFYMSDIPNDEVWFHLSGHINSQNGRLWSAFIPREIMFTSCVNEGLVYAGKYYEAV